MEKSRWIVTSGKAYIGNKEIIYTPENVTDQAGNQQSLITFIRSNVEFENGEIKFIVNLKNTYDRCQIILDNINIGLNTLDKTFGIIKYDFKLKKWDTLYGSGSPASLKINKGYEITIKVNGSNISLYVDGIEVASAIQEIRQSQIQLFLAGNGEIIVKNIRVNARRSKAFVVMQFTEEYNNLYEEVIKPVCEEYNLDCERGDDVFTTTPIIQDIIESITSSSIIIAEITPDNPNVFYEVGYAHAIGKPTILLCDRKREKLPFDISGFRTLFYDNTIAGKSKVERDFKKYLENIF